MEQELKLEFPDIESFIRFKQDAWFNRLFPSAMQRHLKMHSYYFDTPDGLLDQRKATVRLRNENEQLVLAIKTGSQGAIKTDSQGAIDATGRPGVIDAADRPGVIDAADRPGVIDAANRQGLFSRLEWEQSVSSLVSSLKMHRQDGQASLDGAAVTKLFADFAHTEPEQAQLDVVLSLIDSKTLICVAEIVFDRLSAVIDLAGSRVETALDEGEYINRGRSQPFYEFEAELLSGTEQPLLQLATCLQDGFQLRPAAGSKLARCLAFTRQNKKSEK